jgi:hypothetical protein
LPGQIDSVQIGRLDRYVRDSLFPAGSLRWSFSGQNLDSLHIRIDLRTRRATIAPLHG